MRNFVQSGDTLTFAAPYTRTSGQGALLGKIFGVATADIANAAKGEWAVTGVFDITKDTSTFANGDPVYWDNTNKKCTSTAQSNWLIGYANIAVYETTQALGGSSGDATVRVRLHGGPARAFFKSAETTGTGSSQDVAHGLGVTPILVQIVPTETTASTVGAYDLAEGSHDATNVVVTVTSGKKFIAFAWA